MRLFNWISLVWGIYGCYLCLNQPFVIYVPPAGEIHQNASHCAGDNSLVWFSVAVKLWLTSYFGYLMVNLLQLSVNSLYIIIRSTSCGQKAARRCAKRAEREDGLPVPLYTMFLEQWLFIKTTKDQRERLHEQWNTQNADFLQARETRLAEDLQRTESELKHTQLQLLRIQSQSPSNEFSLRDRKHRRDNSAESNLGGGSINEATGYTRPGHRRGHSAESLGGGSVGIQSKLRTGHRRGGSQGSSREFGMPALKASPWNLESQESSELRDVRPSWP